MDLLQNPFHVLNASLFDSRQRIAELFEERVVQLDPQLCRRARAELINPRRRLAAEMAWLPGLGPKRAQNAISILEHSFSSLRYMTKLPLLARANLLAAGIARLADSHPILDVTDWVLELAEAFEKLRSDLLYTTINNDRLVSGFREIADISMVEEALRNRRQYYRRIIEGALNNLTDGARVQAVTQMVREATANGTQHGPALIEDVVDSYYALKMQALLEDKAANIKMLVDQIGKAADYDPSDRVIESKIHLLTKALQNWNEMAQPIQISASSRGLAPASSMDVASHVSYLARFLFDQSRPDLFWKLNHELQTTFVGVVQIIAIVADAAAEAHELEHQNPYLRTY